MFQVFCILERAKIYGLLTCPLFSYVLLFAFCFIILCFMVSNHTHLILSNLTSHLLTFLCHLPFSEMSCQEVVRSYRYWPCFPFSHLIDLNLYNWWMVLSVALEWKSYKILHWRQVKIIQKPILIYGIRTGIGQMSSSEVQFR